MAASYPARLFLNLTSENDIEQLLTDVENRFVDFKQADDHAKGPDLRKHLSKAFSGFANSEGGVLILGVKDKPRKPKPVAQPSALQERVEAFASRLVSPGVKIDSKSISRADGSGYVIVHIHASDRGPHMAMTDGVKHRYYFRHGDSHLAMEHFQVADMFGRRPKARLRARGILQRNTDGTVRLEIALENLGRRLARFPFMRIEALRGIAAQWKRDLHGEQNLVLKPRPFSNRHEFVGGADHALHPRTCEPVFRFEGRGTPQSRRSAPFAIIDLALAAEGFALEEQEITIDSVEYDDFLEVNPAEKHRIAFAAMTKQCSEPSH